MGFNSGFKGLSVSNTDTDCAFKHVPLKILRITHRHFSLYLGNGGTIDYNRLFGKGEISNFLIQMTNKMQLCRIIYCSLAALHVSSDIFTHHQEHLNCITASGITHVCRCRLVSWECWNYYSSSNTPMIPATYVCNTRSCFFFKFII